jgi:serine/threonine-protein kinase
MKPENILVRPDGLVKILDFGMAHSPAHDAEWEMTSGTPRYMSPEQCRSTRIGVETDIFSLGIVFYEMITGRCPFEGDSAWDTMTSIVEDAPEPPSKWNPAIHRQLDALILSMLRKKAADRPTAGQVTESLERLTRATLGAPAVWATVENMVSRAAAWVSKPVHAIWRGLSVASGRTPGAVPTPLLD